MRVTNQMLTNNFLNDMNNNLQNMSKIQSQMTSGKEISKPSDDPMKIARVMQLNTDMNSNKQYNENISDASNYLDITDKSLGYVGDVLQRIRELLVSAGKGSYGSDEKAAIKNEINQSAGQLTQILNTNFDGKYIFGGTKGTTKPVKEITDVTTKNTTLNYNVIDPAVTTDPIIGMINGKLSVEVSQGVSMEYNITAGDVLKFNDSAGAPGNLDNNLTTIFTKITSDLDATSTTELSGKDLTDIQSALTNILKLRSEVGAKSNRMDSMKSKNSDEMDNMTKLLSNTEDIDITEKTMQYATMQTIYTATLQTSAKVLQLSLMDYLR